MTENVETTDNAGDEPKPFIHRLIRALFVAGLVILFDRLFLK